MAQKKKSRWCVIRSDDYDEDVLDTMFTKLDKDESGEIDVLEFAAATDDGKAAQFRDVYVEMEKTFIQFSTCRAFAFYACYTLIYFSVVHMQLDVNTGFEVEQVTPRFRIIAAVAT